MGACSKGGRAGEGGVRAARACPHRHTIQTYQHLLPGMGAEAARSFERLAGPVPTTDPDTVERRGNNRRNTA